MRDIRRQRHLSELIEDFLKNALILKPDQAVALVHNLLHLGVQKSAAEG